MAYALTTVAHELEPFFNGTRWNRAAVIEAQRARAAVTADRLGWPLSERSLLSDPLDPAFVEEFERFHQITLPQEYRSFLLQVGDGGDGPGLAMRPLGAPFDDSLPWQEGEIASGPDEPNRLLAEPFAHVEAVELEPAEATPETTAGGLYLFDHGCALWDLLIVTGGAAGQIWCDRVADGDGLGPATAEDGHRMGFAEFYCRWLGGRARPGGSDGGLY